MTFAEDSLRRPDMEAERPGPWSNSAWALLAIAVGWTLLAFASAFATGVVIGIVKVALKLQDTPELKLLVTDLAVGAFGTTLLWGAIVSARSVGKGDVRAGLDFTPIARLPLMIFLAIILVAYAVLRDYAVYKIRPDLFFQFRTTSPWLILLNLVATVALAPVAEEFFFRGWLWSGLRQRWHALPTAIVTAAFWLVLHWERGFALVAALLPVALIVTLARQVGNSVRATIPLHAIYNLAVSFPLILMSWSLMHQYGWVPNFEVPPAHQPVFTAPMKPATPWPAPSSVPVVPPFLGTTPQSVSPKISSMTVVREIFSGSESRIAAMTYINPDCSSGLAPEVRIVSPPANGDVRLQQETAPLARGPNDPMARCNGKPADGVTIYYKSKSGYTGTDTVMVEVDFRHGTVRRFLYSLNVR